MLLRFHAARRIANPRSRRAGRCATEVCAEAFSAAEFIALAISSVPSDVIAAQDPHARASLLPFAMVNFAMLSQSASVGNAGVCYLRR